jgi:hypothetical protein
MRTKYAPLGLALQGVANLYLPLYCDLPEMAAGHAAEAAAHPGVVLGAYCGDVSHAPEGQTDNALVGLHSLPGVRLIGYMDRTGCHQLNRVLTHNDNVVKSGCPTLRAGRPVRARVEALPRRGPAYRRDEQRGVLRRRRAMPRVTARAGSRVSRRLGIQRHGGARPRHLAGASGAERASRRGGEARHLGARHRGV